MFDSSDISAGPPDFSEPWKFSDVILVVDEQRFHVHRGVLAFWSPVFDKMFTSDFREKTSNEISLPEKNAGEIKELLQIMYPSLEEKVVTKGNCYFLLELAREYQIISITQKCENFLVSVIKTKEDEDVIAELVVGQSYELKTLVKTCVYVARRLSLKELKEHTKRDEIEPENYLQIAEGIITRLEETCKEVKENCEKVKKNCSAKLNALSSSLFNHATHKGIVEPLNSYRRQVLTVKEKLNALKKDDSKDNCSGLGWTATCLEELQNLLQEL
ncbi:BTB and MATH domain-containing protein 45-like [Stylophora pistillata]|uniref:BTB and MATH domain-containing protein 45-like n=1 Tax=Stylophora pistillata TaxID=50429 RepID=UPI000C04930E|nr:BTB and MATH domain-containing protein 45-like [Stylophora pistillata]